MKFASRYKIFGDTKNKMIPTFWLTQVGLPQRVEKAVDDSCTAFQVSPLALNSTAALCCLW
jgi:hypothetical protein